MEPPLLQLPLSPSSIHLLSVTVDGHFPESRQTQSHTLCVVTSGFGAQLGTETMCLSELELRYCVAFLGMTHHACLSILLMSIWVVFSLRLIQIKQRAYTSTFLQDTCFLSSEIPGVTGLVHGVGVGFAF